MTGHINIVGLGGSLALSSRSLAALRLALEGAGKAGAVTELFDVRELDLPIYDPEERNPPDSVRRLCDAVANADGLIWSSPLYHGTISGAFKNALDWLQLLSARNPPYLTDKVVGLVGAAGGTHGLQAINTMEYVVRALRGWTVPLVVPVSRSWAAFDSSGAAADPQLAKQLKALGEEVTRMARVISAGPLTGVTAAKAATLLPVPPAK